MDIEVYQFSHEQLVQYSASHTHTHTPAALLFPGVLETWENWGKIGGSFQAGEGAMVGVETLRCTSGVVRVVPLEMNI